MVFPVLPDVTDQLIYDMWFTRYQLPTIALAVKLNIFRIINEEVDNIQALATKLRVDLKGVDALCTFLAAMGLLLKNKDAIQLTATAQIYLLPDSDFFWGPAFGRVHDTSYYKELSDAIEKSEGYLLSAGGKSFTDMWETANISLDAAEKFTAVMQSTIFYAAIAAVQSDIFKGIHCLVDVGGGSGCFATAFVKKYPRSSAIVFEIPEVSKVTEKYLQKFQVCSKVKIVQGNFFKDKLPKGDGILFSNILHDWLSEQVNMLLEKAYEALEFGGRIIIHEMLLSEEKNGPMSAAAFNLLMYINHRSQQFTFSELSTRLSNAGFKNISLTQHHTCYSLITAYK